MHISLQKVMKSCETLLAFRALDTHDPRRGFTLRKHVPKVLCFPRDHDPRSYDMLHWPRKASSSLSSKNATVLRIASMVHGADSLRLPRKTQSFERCTLANVLATSAKHCTCHAFHKVPDSWHQPCKLTFQTSTAADSRALRMQNALHVRRPARTPGKTMPSKLRFPRCTLCMSPRSRNQHGIPKRHSGADETTGTERAPQ